MQKQTQPEHSPVLIAGGGVPGLALALRLGGAGIACAVIDPSPSPSGCDDVSLDRIGNHTTALTNSSLEILARCGVDLDQFPARPITGEMAAIHIRDMTRGANNIKTAYFSAQHINQNLFGLNIPEMPLRQYLKKLAQENPYIHCYFGQSVASFTPMTHNVHVRLGNDISLSGKLLIGADGRNSIVRRSSNIQIRQRDYHQDALIFLIRHSRDHAQTSTELHHPGGPMTFVPLRDDRGAQTISSVVWVERRDKANALLRLKKQDFEQATQDRSCGILGEISLLTTPQSRSLQVQSADRFIAPRVALMAEAAHVLHPMGAQGLNLSLRDGDVLAEILIERARLGLDIGGKEPLSCYETARQSDVKGRLLATHSLVRSLNHDFIPGHILRRKALNILDKWPMLKTIAMRAGQSASV